jgi:hypothetical protein
MTLSDVGQKAKTIVILVVCIPWPLEHKLHHRMGIGRTTFEEPYGSSGVHTEDYYYVPKYYVPKCTLVPDIILRKYALRDSLAAEQCTSLAIGQTQSRQSLASSVMHNLVSSVMIILRSFELYFQGFSGLYYMIFRAVVPYCIGSAGSSGQLFVLPASHATLNTQLRCQCLWRLYECISAVILSA